MKISITETVGEVALTYAVEYEEHQAEEALIQLVDLYELMRDPEPEVTIENDLSSVVTAIAGEEVEKFAAVGIGSDGRVYGVRY